MFHWKKEQKGSLHGKIYRFFFELISQRLFRLLGAFLVGDVLRAEAENLPSWQEVNGGYRVFGSPNGRKYRRDRFSWARGQLSYGHLVLFCHLEVTKKLPFSDPKLEMCTPKDCFLQTELTSPRFWGHQRWRGLWRIHHCLSVITASDALDEFFRKQSGDSGEAPDPKWVSARSLAMPIREMFSENLWWIGLELPFIQLGVIGMFCTNFGNRQSPLPTISFHLGQGCATLAEIWLVLFRY